MKTEVWDPRAALLRPLRWRKEQRVVYVTPNLFAEGVSNESLAAVFGIMAQARRLQAGEIGATKPPLPYRRAHTYHVLVEYWPRWLTFCEWLRGEAPERARDYVERVAEAERLCGETPGQRGATMETTSGECLTLFHYATKEHAALTGLFHEWPLPHVRLWTPGGEQ